MSCIGISASSVDEIVSALALRGRGGSAAKRAKLLPTTGAEERRSRSGRAVIVSFSSWIDSSTRGSACNLTFLNDLPCFVENRIDLTRKLKQIDKNNKDHFPITFEQ
jgi:hypothetical protein